MQGYIRACAADMLGTAPGFQRSLSAPNSALEVCNQRVQLLLACICCGSTVLASVTKCVSTQPGGAAAAGLFLPPFLLCVPHLCGGAAPPSATREAVAAHSSFYPPMALYCPSQCVLRRRGAAIGYWGNLMITAVVTGFSGSLTTVSTFITEVRHVHCQGWSSDAAGGKPCARGFHQAHAWGCAQC